MLSNTEQVLLLDLMLSLRLKREMEMNLKAKVCIPTSATTRNVRAQRTCIPHEFV